MLTHILVLAGIPVAHGFSWALNGTSTACEPSGGICKTIASQTTLLPTPTTIASGSRSWPLSGHHSVTRDSETSTATLATLMANGTSEPVLKTLGPTSLTSSSTSSDRTASSSPSPMNTTGSIALTAEAFSSAIVLLDSTIGPPAQLIESAVSNMTVAAPKSLITADLLPTPSVDDHGQTAGSATDLTGTPTSALPVADSSSAAITATVTTMPNGVSTERISSPGVSTNTWYTTTKDSQTTILPVIWHSDRDQGEPILVWGLAPSLTNIEFAWPGMPDFSLTCVKVFGLPNGNCPPGTSESGEGDSDATSPTTLALSSTNTASSSSSNSEPCVSTTVRDCRVGCAVSTLSINSVTTVCYTTYCSSSVGCSAQPTTTTSVTSSSRSQRTLKQEPTPYNIAATWSALGMSTLAWYLGATLTRSAVDPQYTFPPDGLSDEDWDDLYLVSDNSTASSASAMATGETAWCYVHGDSNNDYHCECGTGLDVVTSPIVSGACPYTSHSIVKTASPATSTAAPATTTLTNFDGSVQECTSFRQLGDGVPGSVCLGPTIASPASVAIEATSTSIEPPITSVEPFQTTTIPATRPKCDHTVSRDGNLWNLEGRGWPTKALKRHVKACGSPKDWELITLTDDPSGWEFKLTFQMNSDYDVCIRNEIQETANC